MFGTKNLLGLPSSKLPIVYRNPLQYLVTTLPYAEDELMDSRIQNQVNQLIQSEMLNMPKQDYLIDLPIPKTFQSDVIQNEMKRMQNSIPMEKTNFESKYIIEIEPQDQQELINAIELTSIKEQHQQINQLNLELMSKYGPDQWKIMLKQQEQEKQRLQTQIDKVLVQTNEVNAQRKYEQLEVKQKIDNYRQRIGELKINNQDLEIECMKVGDQITSLTRKKMVKIDNYYYLSVLTIENGKTQKY